MGKTKSSKSCPFRNRPVPVNVPALRPSLPSATTMDTSVWALSAPKKWPPPSVVPLSWPSSQSFPFVVVSGVTKLDSPYRSLQGHWQVRFYLGEAHPRSQRYCIVSAPVPKKLLQMAGIEDCYTTARGSTGTLGNFAKATYAAIAKTYAYLTPDLWK